MSSAAVFVGLLAFGQMGPDPVRKIIRDFPHGVACLAFSPDGKTLATGTRPSEGGRDALRLWDVGTGKEICSLGNDHYFGCSSLAFSPDGKTLLANDGPGETLQLWDLSSRKVRLTIKVPKGVGTQVAISPDSNMFAASDYGPPVRLFDMKTGKERIALAGGFKALSIVFSPDAKLIAASSKDGLVVIWDVATGKQRVSLNKHTRYVRSLAFSPDSKTLYSLGEDRLLVYWDVASGKEKAAIDLRNGRAARYAALSPDGNTMALMGGGFVRLVDLKRLEFWPMVEWAYQPGGQTCLTFSPDGKLIACGAGGNPTVNSVYFYNVPPRKDKPKE